MQSYHSVEGSKEQSHPEMGVLPGIDCVSVLLGLRASCGSWNPRRIRSVKSTLEITFVRVWGPLQTIVVDREMALKFEPRRIPRIWGRKGRMANGEA